MLLFVRITVGYVMVIFIPCQLKTKPKLLKIKKTNFSRIGASVTMVL
jgi:hypothetical protein